MNPNKDKEQKDGLCNLALQSKDNCKVIFSEEVQALLQLKKK
jgi:hypothetical protein